MRILCFDDALFALFSRSLHFFSSFVIVSSMSLGKALISVVARSAIMYRRFRRALRQGVLPLSEVVRSSDEALAEVIDTLPEHLQPLGENSHRIGRLEQQYPWIHWQRFDITLVLLHHPLAVNRVLQKAWLKDPEFAGSRAICLQSARHIMWITKNWELPIAKRRQWYEQSP